MKDLCNGNGCEFKIICPRPRKIENLSKTSKNPRKYSDLTYSLSPSVCSQYQGFKSVQYMFK